VDKSVPMGNEYHSVCCGVSGTIYSIKLVEGKDRPLELPPPKFYEKGKTAGLLLRLTESIAHSGRVAIMDSGFCVLRALVNLFEVGIFASAVFKKRRYWPKYYIDENAIDSHIKGKPVGTVETLLGKLLDGAYGFKVFAMKEEDIRRLRGLHVTNLVHVLFF
jgi:Transposase IS4